ncbi:MAG: 4,5-DOPA dioxygenase extradiol [Prosthecobacter sp.]|nr:4,5-DOPA dioxygenase extradiol [Prosthecobacter sp.]
MNLHQLDRLIAAKPPSERQPAIFIGHGSPMNIIRDNAFTQSLKILGQQSPRPAAVLVISAHWLTPNETRVSVNPEPAIIHDFGGFPEELYQQRYPAHGHPALAGEVVKQVTSLKIHEDHEMGLDHGAWSVLRHIWPQANIPVFQLSIDYAEPPQFHYDLARQLQSLRDRGVLILGSGNIVHNLRRISWEENDPHTPEWAQEFDTWAKSKLEAGDHQALVNYAAVGAAAHLSVPTNDHYLPLLYTLGTLAKDEGIRFTYEGFQNASISMRSLQSVAA